MAGYPFKYVSTAGQTRFPLIKLITHACAAYCHISKCLLGKILFPVTFHRILYFSFICMHGVSNCFALQLPPRTNYFEFS